MESSKKQEIFLKLISNNDCCVDVNLCEFKEKSIKLFNNKLESEFRKLNSKIKKIYIIGSKTFDYIDINGNIDFSKSRIFALILLSDGTVKFRENIISDYVNIMTDYTPIYINNGIKINDFIIKFKYESDELNFSIFDLNDNMIVPYILNEFPINGNNIEIKGKFYKINKIQEFIYLTKEYTKLINENSKTTAKVIKNRSIYA